MNPRSLGVACVLVALLLSGCATGPATSPAAANALDHPVSLRDTDAQPVAIKRVAPEYPVALRKAGVTGDALIDFIVDANGEVVRPTVVRATNAALGGRQSCHRAMAIPAGAERRRASRLPPSGADRVYDAGPG